MRKVAQQSITGEAGVAMIASRVNEMGHLWHPTSGIDSGIDGEIELRDPDTGAVRNFRIGVQSKATTGTWARESPTGFVWRAKPAEIDYWMSSNQPVLLVCSRPSTGEAFWRNVQEWGRDPAVRSTGIIEFDKQRDVFDRTASTRLFEARAQSPNQLEPPGPEREPDRLRTNLLPVVWLAESLWTVDPGGSGPDDVFAAARDGGAPRGDVVFFDGRLWRLVPFDEAFLDAIDVREAPTSEPLNGLLASPGQRRSLVPQLIRRAILAGNRRDIRWSPEERVAYFRLLEEGKDRRYRWAKGKGRTVVKARASRKHDGLSGYRHDAFRLGVRCLASEWFVVVSPTYLFTLDGTRRSSFHADALKKMRALDRAAAVSQQLRMWEHLLTRQRGFWDEDNHPFRLDGYREVELPVRPPEGAWSRDPSGVATEMDDEHAQLRLGPG